MTFHDKLKDLIVLFENLLSNPQDETQLEQWKDSAEIIAYGFVFTDAEQDRVELIIDMYEEQLKKKIEWHRNHCSVSTVPIAYLDELIGRKQLEQRTTAWYQQLSHPTDPRCTASPDGLIYHCPLNQRTGRLIEIKCPVTREIKENNPPPPDYYSQMQMQLQVTGLSICDYVEAGITSKYNNKNIEDIASPYSGFVALVRYAEPKGNQEFYYVYSPLNVDNNWTPDIKQEEEIIEIIPWKLKQWNEQLVRRNEEWWVALQPALNSFWEDVEKAKHGEFTKPESSRAPIKLKTEPCRIQFHKMDECGQLIP